MTSGQLFPLKTSLEIQARDTLIGVYITLVPIKLANSTLNLLRAVLPSDGGLDIQHLRRYAQFHELPDGVRSVLSSPTTEARLLLIASVNATTVLELQGLLSPTLGEVEIHVVSVPLVAPTSQEQAAAWSRTYWPTVYRKTNSFGPHPSLYGRAADEIRGGVGCWMGLAAAVGEEALAEGWGERVGVVIVERGNVVAVAGDARWVGWRRSPGSAGNVSAHAVLRAIGMVAEGLRLKHDGEDASSSAPTIFQDQPLGKLEQEYSGVERDREGYLCHGLEIYCTHEPCVMCSMAIVHSRFAKVVFGHKMAKTGGICADGELGHGLFWRKELNWNLLAWQWLVPDGSEEEYEGHVDLNA